MDTENSVNKQVQVNKMDVDSKTDEEEIDLAALFYKIKQHLVGIVLLFVVGAILAFSYSQFLIKPKYTATSKVYILSGSGSVVDLSSLQISSQLKADYQVLLTSDSIMENVISALSLDAEPSELVSQIEITNPTDTRILNISVTDKDPQLAASIANELAQQAKSYLPEVMKTDTPSVFEDAKVPTEKSSPNVRRNTMIGGFALAALYIAKIVFDFVTNDTFVTGNDLYNRFGVMPLATVPEVTIKGFDTKRRDKQAKRKKKRSK